MNQARLPRSSNQVEETTVDYDAIIAKLLRLRPFEPKDDPYLWGKIDAIEAAIQIVQTAQAAHESREGQ